jgi:hypothetical protein
MADTNTNNASPSISYLALSFDTVEVGNDGQKRLKLCDRFTDKRGHDSEHPLEISARKCFLTLRVLQDKPKQSIESNGNVTYSYDHKVWHMEHNGELMTENSRFTIVVVCRHLGTGIGTAPKFNFDPSGDEIVQLGEINLTGGDYEYELVGDVHRCFWNEPIFPQIYRLWRFKKPSERLKYYIRVN